VHFVTNAQGVTDIMGHPVKFSKFRTILKHYFVFFLLFLFGLYAWYEEKNVSPSPTTYLKFTRWRHLTCETACITVIQQAVSQVKNLQGVNCFE